MSRPAHAHPALPPFLAATESLVGPGSPFEVAEEDVLGEVMQVFRHRPRSLREVLVGSFRHGDRTCKAFSDGTSITFAELEQQVGSVAAWLREVHRIEPGDRVAICGANSAAWILSFWACASLGAVAVAMNGWWTDTEMRHALELSEPTLLLIDAKRAERLGDAPMPVPRADLDSVPVNRASEPIPDAAIDEDDAAILIFTSGTTGRAKAAVLSHRSVIAYSMLQSFIGARGLLLAGLPAPEGPPPARLAVFPLFHVSGLGGTVNAIMTGSPSVWPLGRFDPSTVIRLTVDHGIAVWAGTGTHVMRLLDHPELALVPPSQLRSVGMGGSATTPAFIRRLESAFPHLTGTASSGYGSTETGAMVSYATNWMLAASPECVGPPHPTVQVRIADPAGAEVREGEEGNIWVRSPLLMLGYWRDDEANAEAFAPGRWFNTGDFGRMEGGLLHIASRRRDLIIRGGENIFPYEVEYRLEEHPEVVEAAVVGADDEVLGQEVRAIVVVVEGSTLDASKLQKHCASTLASFKVPAHVEIRTSPLPRNPSGKVLKHVLAKGSDSGFVGE